MHSKEFSGSRSLVALAGGALVFAAVGCADRSPISPETGGPLVSEHFAVQNITLGAYGTPKKIDGEIEGDPGWVGVSPQAIFVDRQGNKDAVAKIFVMNDMKNLYLGIELRNLTAGTAVVRMIVADGSTADTLSLTKNLDTNQVEFHGVDRWAATGNNPLFHEALKSLRKLRVDAGGPLGVRFEIDPPGASGELSQFPGNGEYATLRLFEAGDDSPLVANANGPYSGNAYVPIQFSSDGSTVADGVVYAWDFGDGSASQEAEPEHAYQGSGSYTATLTVSDGTHSVSSSAQVQIDPTVQIEVLSAGAEGRCSGMSVLARNTALEGDFHVTLTDSDCMAGFDLPIQNAYVFSVRNTLTEQFEVWPNQQLAPTETDPDLPERLGVVCREINDGEDCSSEILTPSSYQSAWDNATALGGIRNLELQFGNDGRVVPCLLPGSSINALVHAQMPLPSRFEQLGEPPPALGIYIHEQSSSGSCELKSIPEGELVVVEAYDGGRIYRGLIGRTGEDPVIMDADPDFFRADYIVDDPTDNPTGKDDIGLTRFGLMSDDGAPGDTMLVKTSVANVQEEGTAQFLITFSEVEGGLLPETFEVNVICSKQQGSCWMTGTSPASVGSHVVVSGVMDGEGDGHMVMKLNFAGVTSARLRIQAGVANSYDYAPDLGMDAKLWKHPGSGNSFTISF